ncbi:hypothetical protein CERSUDRAFT_118951 [Gelatoporia subvermispora B]|uniref:Uncharacterized protein n=1 Tax=Ceriporiopsis subvermispora (strain B) TaxID=914234 RepID=M2Q5Z3_CERS8|nr:hypothetical protein CERSUDRAFT_118951 [Gelatoporia subvermispora B]
MPSTFVAPGCNENEYVCPKFNFRNLTHCLGSLRETLRVQSWRYLNGQAPSLFVRMQKFPERLARQDNFSFAALAEPCALDLEFRPPWRVL